MVPEALLAKIPPGWAARMSDLHYPCGDGPIYTWDPKVVDPAVADRLWSYEGVNFWVPRQPVGTPAFEAALAATVQRVRVEASAWLPTPETLPVLRPFFEAAAALEGAHADVAEHAMRAWVGRTTAPLLEPIAGFDVPAGCSAVVAALPAFDTGALWWHRLQYDPTQNGRSVGMSWMNCVNKLTSTQAAEIGDLGVETMKQAGAVYIGDGDGGC